MLWSVYLKEIIFNQIICNHNLIKNKMSRQIFRLKFQDWLTGHWIYKKIVCASFQDNNHTKMMFKRNKWTSRWPWLYSTWKQYLFVYTMWYSLSFYKCACVKLEKKKLLSERELERTIKILHLLRYNKFYG